MPDVAANEIPLIAGAGPVGLAAALFLARDGVKTRVIDRHPPRPATQSRALAVNPRTLALLAPTGIADQMLALGLPIRGATMWRRGREVLNVSFAELDEPQPFLLALSQHATERLLHEAFVALGGRVLRGVALESCEPADDRVRATIALPDGASETRDVPWLFAADGSHSVARAARGIPFPGPERARQWHLVDVPLDTDLAENRAHIIFLPDGFLFLLRVVDGDASPTTAAPRWRVMGNVENPLARFTQGKPVAPPVWTSAFTIAHRVAGRLSDGNIYLAGDAAHVHSPVGARGMNLGIEDAWTFAKFLRERRLDRYGATRHAIDTAVVGRIARITAFACAESAAAKTIRRIVPPLLPAFSPLRQVMLKTLSGLDHALP